MSTRDGARTCYIGDETGLVKQVFFPDVFAKPSVVAAANFQKKRKAPEAAQASVYRDGSDDESEVNKVEELKKAAVRAVKPQVTRLNEGVRQERAEGIDCMCLFSDSKLGLVTHSGILQEWNPKSKTLLHQTKQHNFSTPFEKKDQTKPRVETIVGLCELGKTCLGGARTVASCSNRGTMRVTKLPSIDHQETSFYVGHPVSKMRPSPTVEHVIALGGKDLDLRLFGLSEQKQIWKARNLPHDWLNMAVPVWVNEICFAKGMNDQGHTMLVGTGYSEIRLYDTRADNRPVHNYVLPSPEGDNPPFMSLCPSVDGKTVFAGDTHGRVIRVDVGSGKVMSKYKGFTGSVRALAVDPTGEALYSASMDRYLRVHDVESRKMSMRVYVKQRLTTMLLV